jgi:lipoprotein-releasing system ATP-binding protein
MILQAKNICKTFTKPVHISVLKDISIEMKPSETVAIIGKSGEGKTTLLHILGSLEYPSTGEITICGLVVNKTTAPFLRNQKIGFIFQNHNLLEEYTALENVLMPAKINRTEKRLKAKALHLLEEVGLSDRTSFQAKFLSGGEKQRVAIARAFLNDPELILADEPSGNLDNDNSKIIYSLLLTSAQKKGKALLIVTHDQGLAALCGKTYTLESGKLLKK